jgi:hypothetical protein
LALHGGRLALRPDEILFDDLVILLIRSKANKAAAAYWKWYKHFAGNMRTAIKDKDPYHTLMHYLGIRAIVKKDWDPRDPRDPQGTLF